MKQNILECFSHCESFRVQQPRERNWKKVMWQEKCEMLLISLRYFGGILISCQMLCIATALRDTFDALFVMLIFYTALFPDLRHFDPSLCFDAGSPGSVCVLRITLIGSAVCRELEFNTFPWSAAKFTKCFTPAFKMKMDVINSTF